MSNLLKFIFLISMYSPNEITIKATIDRCIDKTLSTAIIKYEIKNTTKEDYILNVYDLQFNWQIRKSLDEILQPDVLIERICKIDTSKNLINHKYIFFKACSKSIVAIETNLFSNYNLNKGESYSVISGYSNNDRAKIKQVPIYNKNNEIEAVKFSVCND